MKSLPLAYGCVDCSPLGDLVHDLLSRLEDKGLAERGCLAGLGAEIGPHVDRLRRAEGVLILDTCALHCAHRCVSRHALAGVPIQHLDLSNYRFLKTRGDNATRLERAWRELVRPALDLLTLTSGDPV